MMMMSYVYTVLLNNRTTVRFPSTEENDDASMEVDTFHRNGFN